MKRKQKPKGRDTAPGWLRWAGRHNGSRKDGTNKIGYQAELQKTLQRPRSGLVAYLVGATFNTVSVNLRSYQYGSPNFNSGGMMQSSLNYEALFELGRGRAEHHAELMYPPGRLRDKEATRLTQIYYSQYVTPPPYHRICQA